MHFYQLIPDHYFLLNQKCTFSPKLVLKIGSDGKDLKAVNLFHFNFIFYSDLCHKGMFRIVLFKFHKKKYGIVMSLTVKWLKARYRDVFRKVTL